jgi:hypothetical protein
MQPSPYVQYQDLQLANEKQPQSQGFPNATPDECDATGRANHVPQATMLPSPKLSHIKHPTAPDTLPDAATPPRA